MFLLQGVLGNLIECKRVSNNDWMSEEKKKEYFLIHPDTGIYIDCEAGLFFFNLENTNFIYKIIGVLNGHNVQLDITVADLKPYLQL